MIEKRKKCWLRKDKNKIASTNYECKPDGKESHDFLEEASQESVKKVSPLK